MVTLRRFSGEGTRGLNWGPRFEHLPACSSLRLPKLDYPIERLRLGWINGYFCRTLGRAGTLPTCDEYADVAGLGLASSTANWALNKVRPRVI